MKFKVGDTVKLKDYSRFGDHKAHKGQTGIVDIVESDSIGINWANGDHSTAWFKESHPYKVSSRSTKSNNPT